MSRTPRSTRSIAAAAALALPGVAAAADFTDGDLYMYSHGWPAGPAVVRIDPVTGATAAIRFPVVDAGAFAHMTYDPYRDRLVLREATSPSAFVLVDATGAATELSHAAWAGDKPIMWASTGDGRIYFNTGSPDFEYGWFDGDDQVHVLYENDGVTPFTRPIQMTSREDLIYDAATNSLILVSYGGGPTDVRVIPLSPDRTRVVGPVMIAPYDAMPGTADEPLGISQGPGGSLFVKIDVNSNAGGVRMFTMDTATMAFSDYAWIEYPFVAASLTGCYNSVHGWGAALDSWNDEIRLYTPGGAPQVGTTLATGVSAGGSGEQARLISIGDTVIASPGVNPCPADADGSTTVDVNDLLGVLAAWGSSDPMWDVAPPGGNGLVDIEDLLAVLGSWGAC